VLGVRTEPDIIYRSYFEKVANAYDSFVPIFTLSRPAPTWRGDRGYITAHLGQAELGVDLAASDVYVCGIPAMVDDTVAVLKRAGTPANQIFAQKFR
jgi:NAD(P)H-flavin reductase